MVSEDLIIGMELNFLKTKRKNKKGKKKKRERKIKERKERRDRRKEKRAGGGENTAGQAQKELFYKILCCYV